MATMYVTQNKGGMAMIQKRGEKYRTIVRKYGYADSNVHPQAQAGC